MESKIYASRSQLPHLTAYFRQLYAMLEISQLSPAMVRGLFRTLWNKKDGAKSWTIFVKCSSLDICWFLNAAPDVYEMEAKQSKRNIKVTQQQNI